MIIGRTAMLTISLTPAFLWGSQPECEAYGRINRAELYRSQMRDVLQQIRL